LFSGHPAVTAHMARFSAAGAGRSRGTGESHSSASLTSWCIGALFLPGAGEGAGKLLGIAPGCRVGSIVNTARGRGVGE
jgi:hypothetical protein